MGELNPDISIIVPTYNRSDYLQDTLHSLLYTSAEANSYEILVIDNNSTDDTPEVVNKVIKLHSDIHIRYIKESKQGLSHARNRGIEEAAAEVLLFLDDDIRTESSFIGAWLSFFKRYPHASGGGGKIQVQFDDPRPEWMSHFLMPLLGHHDLGDSIKTYPANKYPFGGNMAFRKEVFDRYGTFHADLGRKGKQLKASEEKEFYSRFDESEQIYYVPKALLYHRVNRQRLTQTYIKKQAIGLGQSIALQLNDASVLKKNKEFANELFKSVATMTLSAGYTFAFQFSKAQMLIKFRRWIWEGYLQQKKEGV